ncbi:hypothetical protein XBO1_1300114 [Xenorhabdus bovienii str. oregonense]|uniref:Uncharacterized protein n=1 Tax=Xenorhabdus bovienii str. oregonense TaxID=1398202 RepID=A0A077P0K4_XENBV|nr:hypothetical protein XBO1_1300114 [Xenorhabdus bovienii str. oregonense]
MTKELGCTLEFVKLVQDKRDNNRSQSIPAGNGLSRKRKKLTENLYSCRVSGFLSLLI